MTMLDEPILEDRAADAVPAMVRFDTSQQRFFADQSRVIAVNWHRQKGKDFCAAAKAVDHAMRTGQDWFIVSLTQRQADATFRKCRNFARAFKEVLKMQGEMTFADSQFDAYDKSIDQAFRFTAREIHLPNGARVVSLPGRDPDTLAGLTGNLILTEFGLFPGGGYNHWSIIFPITTRGFQLIAISTPRGKNTKFYELCQDTETYSVHTCDIYQSVDQEGFILRDNRGQPCTIAEFRRIYHDEGKWPREFECQFTGDLSTLLKWAEIEEAAGLGEGLDFSFLRVENDAGWNCEFFRSLASGGSLAVGWDVARTGHLSSLWVNLRQVGKPAHLRYLVLMHNTSFALQRTIVRAAMDSARGRSTGCGDNTGLGMDSNETLQQIYRDRWEPINFGGGRKKELASGLVTAFGDHNQTIPPLASAYKFVATDLYAIQKDDTGGQLVLDETDNPLLAESHCDIAWSGALARMAGLRNPIFSLPPSQMSKPVGW